jgi:outer membrane protein OmpA-like peptidoglycan-associated protein
MAFNLDKNDGPVKSKFDLSKSDESTPDLPIEKPTTWAGLLKKFWWLIVVIVGVLIFGIYNNNKTSSTADTNITTDTAAVVASTDTATATQSSSSTTEAATSAAPQVNAPVTFEKASADVNNVDEAKLTQILDYLKSNASATITIEGYASSEGELNFNLNLSELRASNFAKFLISKGVNKDNLKTVGKGIDNPIASNDDEAGRSQNRRIEIKF